jgi:hypothetical protein
VQIREQMTGVSGLVADLIKKSKRTKADPWSG